METPYEVKLSDSDPERDYRTELQIVVNGKVVEEHWDGGEPEDNLFCRDWAWVPTALENAFKLGAEYGQKLIRQSRAGLSKEYFDVDEWKKRGT